MSDTPPPTAVDTPSPHAESVRARSRRRRARLSCLPFLALLFLVGGLGSLTGYWFALGRLPEKPSFPPMPLAYAYVPSPHFDMRPPDVVVDCVVLHSTVTTTVEETVRVFLDPVRKVSAHFIVGKEGQIVQMVPVEMRAWHAGISELEGISGVNAYSVGIEMVNRNDGRDPYPKAQYEAVAGLLRFLRSRYAIPDSRIVSHAQVALPKGRKSDPLGFDFDRVRALARAGR